MGGIRLLVTLLALFIFQNTFAQFATRFNTGMSFSKPLDDLGETYVEGRAMQIFLSGEGSYHQRFSKNTDFGVRGAVVLSRDFANFLKGDRLTELKTSVTSVKARIYPLSYGGENLEGLEKMLPDGLPFLLSVPVWIGVYSIFNSLHFDYGVGAGKILETAYIDDYNFQDQTVTRTMRYKGWGLQPIIYQSESETWTWNAVFDFGKYSWKNAGGGTSSFKSNQVGFGVQYRFN